MTDEMKELETLLGEYAATAHDLETQLAMQHQMVDAIRITIRLLQIHRAKTCPPCPPAPQEDPATYSYMDMTPDGTALAASQSKPGGKKKAPPTCAHNCIRCGAAYFRYRYQEKQGKRLFCQPCVSQTSSAGRAAFRIKWEANQRAKASARAPDPRRFDIPAPAPEPPVMEQTAPPVASDAQSGTMPTAPSEETLASLTKLHWYNTGRLASERVRPPLIISDEEVEK